MKGIERVIDSSKQSTPVMLAANGTGTLLLLIYMTLGVREVHEVLHITGQNQAGSTLRHLSIGSRRLLYHSSVVKRARSV